MAERNDVLKIEIISRCRTQRAFLDDLHSSNPSLQLDESRLSKIITGHVKARPAERRAFAWRLQKSIKELFGEANNDK